MVVFPGQVLYQWSFACSAKRTLAQAWSAGLTVKPNDAVVVPGNPGTVFVALTSTGGQTTGTVAPTTPATGSAPITDSGGNITWIAYSHGGVGQQITIVNSDAANTANWGVDTNFQLMPIPPNAGSITMVVVNPLASFVAPAAGTVTSLIVAVCS